METQGGPLPTSLASSEANLCTNDDHRQHVSAIIDDIMAGKNIFFDLPDKLTGEMWTLKFHCIGAQPGKEIVTVNIDKAYVVFYNVAYIKSRLGYSGRDFLFYKKRCGGDRSRLVALDFNDQEEDMLLENADERKIRFVLAKDQPNELEVNITPMKRARKQTNADEEALEEAQIDAYKNWLAILKHDNPETDLMDDFREETIKTYKEWLRHQGDLPNILSYEQQSNDDDLSDEEIQGSSKPTTDWPSHARRHRKRDPDSSGAFKKEGRGTLKGIAVATKRIKNGDHKLKIEFSSKLGGTKGSNARSFVDEVVLFTKKKAPLIGVKKWKDIERHVRSSIASDILRRWDFPDNEDAHEKIWSIAKERYKGWRSALSATYKAYNTYAERMKNKPEDVDIVEWHYLMLYFGSEKFQKISGQNSKNRKKQRTKHRMGSKSFSQVSFEQRDPETGQEPSDLALWMSTHCKNGEWLDEASRVVYEKAYEKIVRQECQAEHFDLTTAEEDAIFQTTFKETTGCKANRLHGHGYLSRYPTRSHVLDSKFLEQARATAATNQKNFELESQVQLLNEKLANEVTERERILQEKMHALQEEEERKRHALREEMRKEMVAALAAATQQASRESCTPTNPPFAPTNPPGLTLTDLPSPTPSSANSVRTSGTNNKKGNVSTNYITPHTLRNAVTKRVHARGGDKSEWVQSGCASQQKGTSP